MPALTIKNIPDALYTRLKQASQLHHRSMNSEVLYCLESVLGARKLDAAEQITVARALRQFTKDHPLTPEQLAAMKAQGRP